MLGFVEIRHSSGNAQHPVMSAGREIHPAHSHLKRSFAAFIESAKNSQLRRGNLRVVKSPAELSLTGRFHSLSDLRGRNAVVLAAQLLVRNGRNLDMHIDAIQ